MSAHGLQGHQIWTPELCVKSKLYIRIEFCQMENGIIFQLYEWLNIFNVTFWFLNKQVDRTLTHQQIIISFFSMFNLEFIGINKNKYQKLQEIPNKICIHALQARHDI